MVTLRPRSLLSLVLSLLLVAGGGVSADSVDIFAVDYAIVAYVVASKDALTTYAVACTAGADPTSCNFAQPYTLIEGPSTVQFQFTAPTGTTTQSLTLACNLQGITSMACTVTGNVNPATSTSYSAPVTTTQSFTYTGSQATPFFSAVPLVTNPSLLFTYTPGSSSTGTTSHVNGTANAAGGSASVTPGIVAAKTTKTSSNETVKVSSMPAPSGTPKNILGSGATYRLTGNGALGMGILVVGACLAGLF